ncbi:alpha/beta hydrolase [Xenorhabdus bovienii]|uniref:Putative esterase/hydrolase n=1 Tax=Xenorhabdus bovienii str. kraussei Becker Underwood TaxID=1398204 RepID=A0A077PUB7_XENBV|nr:alpha/beta hydrolase [Xenorhabdus bovienii]CDH24237.1 putative esterase/hydrolase [Xenorhabdus bovienii str. kraussei Becker Underwood]
MGNRFVTKTALLGSDVNFEVTILQAESAARCVLFVTGLGGNPLRHLGLLQTFAEHGISVVAPHFEMLASSIPTKAELLERSRRLTLAAKTYCSPGISIAGVGHSIGTVILLMQVGAEASTLAGDRLKLGRELTLDRLVLFTPPTDFFRRPGSLTSVNVPIQVWAAGKDAITPPAQTVFLKETIGDQTQIDVHLVEDAGHFTFMNELPPYVTDPHPDRSAFLLSLGDEVSRFLTT